MNKDSKILVCGHRGLVGSALVQSLKEQGYHNLLLRTHTELDLMNQSQTLDFFKQEFPEYVFLAAAKVGGILANNTYPAEFIHNNLQIQSNVIHSSYLTNVKRLLFLGSSCIYPKESPQPIKEEYLLTGPLEPTNRPYAIAKIAGIEMCWSYNRQYGTKYLAAMPTNLYGANDNFDLNNSHVIPALLRKFDEAKKSGSPTVEVWGTGKPRREFMNSTDMASACVFLMTLSDQKFMELANPSVCPLINIGVGHDVTIRELAELVSDVVGFKGKIVFDETKPDGTFRKLMDVSKLSSMGWKYSIELKHGLSFAYESYLNKDK
ncbi:GDP-L-fucose synthase family protein [Bdellovibrio sp. HCB2-146]|uniref:GDP-L-fucose synthase family protein n=1 Tax=Bdellovibrio sp. HCB2-146 TaxID=3394362 RepID=UPI0039BD4AD8